MVLAQSEISAQREPLRSVGRECQFDSSTVRVRHITREQLARIGQLARLHQLITIEHIVEVYTERHNLCIIGISGLHIEHLLRGRIFALADIGEVVARRLLLSHRSRGVDGVITSKRVVQTEFRIEEVVATVYIESLHRTRRVVEVVVHARNAVCDVAILHIGIEV